MAGTHTGSSTSTHTGAPRVKCARGAHACRCSVHPGRGAVNVVVRGVGAGRAADCGLRRVRPRGAASGQSPRRPRARQRGKRRRRLADLANLRPRAVGVRAVSARPAAGVEAIRQRLSFSQRQRRVRGRWPGRLRVHRLCSTRRAAGVRGALIPARCRRRVPRMPPRRAARRRVALPGAMRRRHFHHHAMRLDRRSLMLEL